MISNPAPTNLCDYFNNLCDYFNNYEAEIK